MGKPTPEELQTALTEAGHMREKDEDPHFLAKSILNMNFRIKILEKVHHSTALYLHSEQGTTEHTRLLQAIKEYESLDYRTEGKEDENFGLM